MLGAWRHLTGLHCGWTEHRGDHKYSVVLFGVHVYLLQEGNCYFRQHRPRIYSQCTGACRVMRLLTDSANTSCRGHPK